MEEVGLLDPMVVGLLLDPRVVAVLLDPTLGELQGCLVVLGSASKVVVEQLYLVAPRNLVGE
jgi:hypothetical protein